MPPTLPPLLPRSHKLALAGRCVDALSRFGSRRNRFTSSQLADLRPNDVGVFCQWGLGDAVLMLPLLQALRARWPEARLTLIGKPWLRDLFSGAGVYDEVLPLVPPWTRYTAKYRVWEPQWREFGRALRAARRQRRFDLLISLRHDPREVAQLAFLRATTTSSFTAAGGRGWIDLDLGTPPHLDGRNHVTIDAAEAARRITGLAPDCSCRLPLPAPEIEDANRRLNEAGAGPGLVLAVADLPGNPIRKWGAANFNAALAALTDEDRVGLVVTVSDPAQPDSEPIRPPENVPHLTWSGSLRQLRGLMGVTDVLLTSDSGVMHIAAASGARVVAVFGPTSRQWYAPPGDGHEVVLIEPMKCRPCMDRCIYREPICLRRLGPEAVITALRRTLRSLHALPPRRAQALEPVAACS